MTRFLLLCAVLVSVAAFADKKEDAEVKACQTAKDTIGKQDACGDENGTISEVICSDPESRKTVDTKKLSAECAKKAKAAKAKAAKAPAKKK